MSDQLKPVFVSRWLTPSMYQSRLLASTQSTNVLQSFSVGQSPAGRLAGVSGSDVVSVDGSEGASVTRSRTSRFPSSSTVAFADGVSVADAVAVGVGVTLALMSSLSPQAATKVMRTITIAQTSVFFMDFMELSFLRSAGSIPKPKFRCYPQLPVGSSISNNQNSIARLAAPFERKGVLNSYFTYVSLISTE